MLRSPTVWKRQALPRLGLPVDAAWTVRRNRRQGQRLKTAKFNLPQACVEEADLRTRRGLDQALVSHLATGQWLLHH